MKFFTFDPDDGFRLLMTCDGCGSELAKAEPCATDINSARWAMNDHLAKTGGFRRERWRGRTLHYCGGCADRAPAKKKTAP